jgi:hypothetical protein
MQRPRQTNNDCVVAVFREITGEDENTAFARFHPHLKGEAGFLLTALSACLIDAGWMLTADNYLAEHVAGPDGLLNDVAFIAFWTQFQGEAVVCYNKNDAKIGHAILVRSGGVAFDPGPSPEDGELIADHFKRVGGRITKISVSRVTRML